MSDSVFIEKLLIRASHGVLEQERQEPQDFLLDISVTFDASIAGSSDHIVDTLDYGRLREIAQRILAGESRHLLEYLATKIAEEALAYPHAAEATVSIRKPGVYPDCVPGVSITRRKTSAA
jgi:dihydroneopterin aldolase / 2-amino-4-hydroxy-6-hydroxymethyldihydropteridine diphosphokinase